MASIRKEKGQGLVEFVIIFMVLMLVVFGVLDLGRVFHAMITITNASREGARYLSLHPTDNADGFAGTKNAAISETQGSILSLEPDQVQVTLCIDSDAISGCDSGYPVRVEVSYPFEFLLGWFSSSPLTLSQATEMIVP
jgi:Flp pilus assembly protein TadG